MRPAADIRRYVMDHSGCRDIGTRVQRQSAKKPGGQAAPRMRRCEQTNGSGKTKLYEQNAPYIERYNSPSLLDQKAVLVPEDAGASAVYAKGFGLQAGQRPASAGHFTASDCLRPKESCTAKVAQP